MVKFPESSTFQAAVRWYGNKRIMVECQKKRNNNCTMKLKFSGRWRQTSLSGATINSLISRILRFIWSWNFAKAVTWLCSLRNVETQRSHNLLGRISSGVFLHRLCSRSTNATDAKTNRSFFIVISSLLTYSLTKSWMPSWVTSALQRR